MAESELGLALERHFEKWGREDLNYPGFRMYGVSFLSHITDEGSKYRYLLMEDPNGQELIRNLEAEGMIVRLQEVVRQRREDSSEFRHLELDICNPKSPLTEAQRALIATVILPTVLHARGDFRRINLPPENPWKMLYMTARSEALQPLDPNIKGEIEEVLAPHIDKDVPRQQIELALAAAELNQKFAWTGEQITNEQVQYAIARANEVRKIVTGGFYSVVGRDSWDSSEPPMLNGEFDTLEEAMQRAHDIVQQNREYRMIIIEEVLRSCIPGSKDYLYHQREYDEVREGKKPATSEVLYVYNPAGVTLEEFFI